MMSSNEQTEAESMAEEVGVVIGAACACDSISQERLKSTLDKAMDIVLEAATDEAEAATAVDCFNAAFGTGQAVGKSGKVDPQQVETAFIELERMLLK